MTDDREDYFYLRAAFDLARQARRAGHRPFGAVIAGGGSVLAEAGSMQGDGDTTSHAEMNAVRAAAARVPRGQLAQATIYASSEPCAMCTAAIFYTGIGRIVFGFPEAQLRTLRNRTRQGSGIGLSCRDVLARAPRAVVVAGPLLEDEAAEIHDGAWPMASIAPLADLPPAIRDDTAFMRHAIDLAETARRAGELPFGAVVVDGDGAIAVEAVSTEVGDGDWTCHAEMNAVRLIANRAGRAPPAGATIYASSEPCAMCATAIFYSGIRRVVYGFSEARLRRLLGQRDETAGLGLSCREVLSHAAESVSIVGPCLEDEAALPHTRYWPSTA